MRAFDDSDIPFGDPSDEFDAGDATETKYDPLDPDSDCFKPPAIPTLVYCLHCGREYESYLIEWRVYDDGERGPHGFWCCPTPDCGGKGFGFDIFPVDPEFYDEENGGWIYDDDEDDDDDDEDDDEFDAFVNEFGPVGDAFTADEFLEGDDDDEDEWTDALRSDDDEEIPY